MHGHIEGLCKPLQVVERDVADLSLNMRNERPMQSGLERQRFLTPSPLLSERQHVQREKLTRCKATWSGSWGTIRHPESVKSCRFYVSRV